MKSFTELINLLLKSFIQKFGYCPLICMFHIRVGKQKDQPFA